MDKARSVVEECMVEDDVACMRLQELRWRTKMNEKMNRKLK